MMRCHHCGEEWKGEARPGFRATCPKCEAYVYVCLNCRFYDASFASGCRLSSTEPVRRKDHPNFCEEFKFAERPADCAPGAQQETGESAREKFDRLFKKP